MEYRLLGPFEIGDGERELTPPVGKPCAVLCLLALSAGDVVPSDVLIEELWGEQPPATAQTALHGYVSQLRRLLGKEAIRTRQPGYLLALGAGDTIDLARAEGLAEEGRAELAGGSPERAAVKLGEALAQWRGAPLADFRYQAFAQAEIARLEELRLSILEDRVEAELALGRHGALVADLEALVAEQPLRERSRAQLMLALYRSGRQAEALDAYQQARRSLVDELGIEPGPELQELNRAILRQDPGLAPATAPATNVPSPSTPLIGRERELVELQKLLRTSELRLLTLTGPGGTGKTRLALEAASAVDLAGAYPGGVWFVGLEAVRDPAVVLETMAQTLGARDDLSAQIGDQRLLVVLDNFEQVVEAAGGLGELLAACPGLHLLVTSRERLHLSGEHEWPVDPLPEADAVALFDSRARAVQPGFASNGDVAEICRRLDGLPLAIELAAARVKVLSPGRILARLEHGLDLLGGGPRDTPERHRTLRATLDWSHELLTEGERRLFRRVAVFAGGFTFEAAEDVCDADLDTLQSLVDKSLVRCEGERFGMLEIVREYGAQLLQESGEADQVRELHAEFFVQLAERAEVARGTYEQTLWLDTLEAEIGNLRAALRWSLTGAAPGAGIRLCPALTWFWYTRSYVVEAGRWLDEAASQLGGASPLEQGRVLRSAGTTAFLLGDEDRARALLEQALTTARENGDRKTEGEALRSLANLARLRGDLDGAIELAQGSLAIGRELGDSAVIADALHVLADSLRDTGDPARASELLEESVRLRRESGNVHAAATNVHSLGDLALQAGHLERAGELYCESLGVARQFGDDMLAAYCLAGLASVAAEAAAFERAARLWGAVEAQERELGVRLRPHERIRYEPLVRAACEAEPEALAAGRELDLDAAVELANTLGGFGETPC